MTQELLTKKLSVVKLSLTRMRNLVDDLSILARLDTSKLQRITQIAVPLHLVVSETAQLMQPLFDESGIVFVIDNPIDAVWIQGERSQLEQLLANLLQNAISYNKPAGTVSLRLERDESEARLIIRDSGIGIKEEDLPRIFERFFRSENQLTHRTAGSGLGLSIVKAIVDLHKGSILVESELGAGTIVSIKFPTVSPPAAIESSTHTFPTQAG